LLKNSGSKPIDCSFDYLSYICMVKFLCTILALMVLVLSVQPVCASLAPGNTCCSSHLCEDEQRSGGQEEDCSSVCNPFQVCGCCAFSVVIPGTIIFIEKPVAQYATVQWGISPVHMVEEPSIGFWQPPKIAA